MSLFSLAMAYVLQRRAVTILSVASIGLGTGLILIVLGVGTAARQSFLQQSQHYDLIAGAVGSETGLVFTALFHADQPRGNMPYADYQAIAKIPWVKAAYPFCLGDQVRGAPIVGTTIEFLRQERDGVAIFPLATGRLFEADFEMVAGADAADRLGLSLGDEVVGAHGAVGTGAEHDDAPYKVVGLLKPTGTAQDRALFTTVPSYWKIHGAPPASQAAPAGFDDTREEVTLVLLHVARPRILQLQQSLARQFGLLVVRPAPVLERMFEQVLTPVEEVLLLYGYAVVLVAACSIASSLYLTTLVRRHDLAVLRAIGATPREIVTLVVLEAFILLAFGTALGILLALFGGAGLRGDLEQRFGLALPLFRFSPEEVYAVIAVFGIGILAALFPAGVAYRGDVSGALRRG